MIGRIIGNYRITSELAQGGMGDVYRGQHVHLPREVVVKSILLGAFSPSAQSHLKARFRREAYIQSQLDHPNIVRVYEFFAAEDNYYIVMEYVPGMTLRELLSRQGVPTAAQAVYLFKQALSALEYAHNFSYVDESDIRHTGIIHRDIKPANILLDHKGKLKLTDFGIVKVLGEQGSGAMTQSGFHPGTIEYMSPEQLLGLDIDVRSDLYSLGVTFYEMLCGRLPFLRSATGSDWEVRKGHIEIEPPPILEIRADIPPTLAAIVMRSLQKSPNERFQTAAEFLEALQIHERTVGVEPVRGITGRLTKPLTGQPTIGDEAATLIAKTRSSKPFPSQPSSQGSSSQASSAAMTSWPVVSSSDASPSYSDSPSGNFLSKEAMTIPIAQSGANNSGRLANAPSQSLPSRSTPVSEETIVVSRPNTSKSKLGLAAAGIGLLLAGTAAGAYFFSNRGSGTATGDSVQHVAVRMEPTSVPAPTATATMTEAAPKPTIKPKPSPTGQSVTVSPEPAKEPANSTPPVSTPDPPTAAARSSNLLIEAKALEDREQYAEALAKYREYQRVNPNSADSSLVSNRIAGLTNAQRIFAAAQADMDSGRYMAAREKYKALLRMKPSSKVAQAGFEAARSKIAATQGDANAAESFPRGNPRRGRRMPPSIQ